MSLAPAVEVGPQNTLLTYDPYPIADLCCKFQVSKGKTVGGDALQRPKSASKIYLVWIVWILTYQAKLRRHSEVSGIVNFTPYTISSNTFLTILVAKSAAGPGHRSYPRNTFLSLVVDMWVG